MMCYTLGKLDRRPLVKSRIENCYTLFPYGKLRFEILKRIDAVRSIKFLIVFAVTAFCFPIMPGCV